MTGKAFPAFLLWVLGGLALCADARGADHELDFSGRVRAVDARAGAVSGRAASVLLRARLTSEWHRNWSSLVELDHVSSTWRDEHSDGRRLNGKPLVPDVPGTVLNQAALRYDGREATVTLGRQRIEWDDQRFVGSDSFWQQDQTFDALLVERPLLMGSSLTYAYVGRAHRIFAEEGEPQVSMDEYDYDNGAIPGYADYDNASLAGEHRHQSHLLRLELNEWDYSQLVAYGHAIDNEDWPESDNDTLGLRYRFAYRSHPLRYRAILEAAAQKRGQGPDEARPRYRLAELAMGYEAFEWLGRYEVLGSDQGRGFVTPLGSSYLFQGFAGAFATTPDAGVEDASVRVNWRSHPWELSLRFHRFSAESGNTEYGRELDAEVQYKLAPKHQLQLRYADFRAHPDAYPQVDQRRVFLDYQYNF